MPEWRSIIDRVFRHCRPVSPLLFKWPGDMGNTVRSHGQAWEAGMPWREVSLPNQRREFILLFQQADVSRRELCARFGISSKTAYKADQSCC